MKTVKAAAWALLLLAAGAGCSELKKGASAAGEKALNKLIGRGGAERGVSIGAAQSPRDAGELGEKGLIPPGAEVLSYIPGVADDTVNISAPSPLAELEAFYTESLRAKGFVNESLIRTDRGLYGRWSGREGAILVYLFRDGPGARGAVVLPKEPEARD